MPSLLNEHQQFFDEVAGVPINNGYIYIGTLGLDPTVLANQLTIYSDAALTTAIDNPQRTGADGRAVNKIYVADGGYSIEVQDSATVQKYNNLNNGDIETTSSSVSFLQAGTGAVSTTVQSKLRETVSVKDFGAVGDGVTDDTAAIQAAIDTGKSVFLPESSSYYKITDELILGSNQRIYGENLSVQIRQTTALKNVISADTKNQSSVENLHLYCIGDSGTLLQSCGVFFQDCDRMTVRGCLIENHKGSGVSFYATSDSLCDGNKFINSPLLHSEDDTEADADIAVRYNSSRNVIVNNIINSGQGTGVAINNVAALNFANDNIVSNNTITGSKIYGISVYRNYQGSGTKSQFEVERTVVDGNVVNTVHGSIQNSVTLTYTYGTGIYLQGAEDSVVSNNTVKDTHNYARTFATLLAPGGISATNCHRYTIIGNRVENDGVTGMWLSEPNGYGDTLGYALVQGNAITNTTGRGIRCVDLERVSLCDNVIDTTSSFGIHIDNNTAVDDDILVQGNQIKNTSNSGISVEFANAAIVSNNIIDTTSVHGISVVDSTNVVIDANVIKDPTTYGISIASSSSDTMVSNNLVKTASSTAGYNFASLTQYHNNKVEGATSDYIGTYAPFGNALPDGDTTPSVKDARHLITGNTSGTTITQFDDGVVGQEFWLIAADANTTIDFSASNIKGNAGVDKTLASGDAIYCVKRSTNWYCVVIDN